MCLTNHRARARVVIAVLLLLASVQRISNCRLSIVQYLLLGIRWIPQVAVFLTLISILSSNLAFSSSSGIVILIQNPFFFSFRLNSLISVSDVIRPSLISASQRFLASSLEKSINSIDRYWVRQAILARAGLLCTNFQEKRGSWETPPVETRFESPFARPIEEIPGGLSGWYLLLTFSRVRFAD